MYSFAPNDDSGTPRRIIGPLPSPQDRAIGEAALPAPLSSSASAKVPTTHQKQDATAITEQCAKVTLWSPTGAWRLRMVVHGFYCVWMRVGGRDRRVDARTRRGLMGRGISDNGYDLRGHLRGCICGRPKRLRVSRAPAARDLYFVEASIAQFGCRWYRCLRSARRNK